MYDRILRVPEVERANMLTEFCKTFRKLRVDRVYKRGG